MREKKTTAVATSVTFDEKAQLQADAAAEGVTVSALIYRRVFNKPDAERRVGRPPQNQPEGLFPMTG